jgi:ribosomal protein S18 acetylase RimI-like enzyme
MSRATLRSPGGSALTLSLDRRPKERDRQAIEDGLHAFNVEATGIGDGSLLTLFLRDGRKRLRGGLLGHTWGGCLTVTHLWIHPRFRNQGHGSRLLAAAESHARARRCRASVLSTHTFQARAFYERLGYRVVAELRDYPYGHGQYFMRKTLRAPRAKRHRRGA